MEIIDMLSNIVANLGFPIAVCCVAFMFLYSESKSHREEVTKIVADHKEEVSKIIAEQKEETKTITEALNNNTLALTRLIEKLDRGI